MFLETAGGIAAEIAAGKAWDQRDKIRAYIADLFDALQKGRVKLFAFGPGGAGKSTLGKLVNGDETFETLPPGYSLSVEIEKYGVSGRNFVALYVPPGQEDKRAFHWDELIGDIREAARYAIINVVSWGYHSLDKIELAQHKLYRPPMTADEFLGLYLAERRQAEIEVLRYLLPHLKTAPGKLRMLTLVTKQDLWWSHRQDVRRFYEQGEYNQLIEELRRHKGEANFSHNLVSGALNLLNLRTADGVILAKTTEGYDKPLMLSNFGEIVTHIKGLAA